jgi:hypothetical protein
VSVYSELVNESGTDPGKLDALLYDQILADPPAPWNLPAIDVLDLWGSMSLRQMFGVLSRGESPTTFTGGMAKLVRAATGPSLLGFEEEEIDPNPDYTQAIRVIETLRSYDRAVEGEVLDERLG